MNVKRTVVGAHRYYLFCGKELISQIDPMSCVGAAVSPRADRQFSFASFASAGVRKLRRTCVRIVRCTFPALDSRNLRDVHFWLVVLYLPESGRWPPH